MSKDDIERIIKAVIQETSTDHALDAYREPGALVSHDVEQAAIQAVTAGEPISIVAAAADMSSLAVLDALEATRAQHSGKTVCPGANISHGIPMVAQPACEAGT